ncbi:MAG: hypothetical protein K9G70_13780 [Prolixibacteraceae bacterium]|nr:hypothetical protein [Prolixibacteraceae bacterium]
MKKITFLYLFIFNISAFISAQTFEDIYESMPDNDRFSNMRNLQHYQKKDPYHAIPYYLLGEIFDEYMRETNPLYMYRSLSIYYDQLVTCYSIIDHMLDKRQVRKDREYYKIEPPANKKKIEKEDIVTEVNKRLDAANVYFDNAKSVHDNYIKCINKYNECLYFYRNILNLYPNYKSFYLQTTDKMKNQVKNMIANFDSTLIYFESYQEACNELPHLLEVNQYVTKPIKTYRLEGLVDSDFEAPVVTLWDFKSWGEDFLTIINTDVNEIHTRLQLVDKKLDKQITEIIERKLYNDDIQHYSPEPKFQNLIGKYDYESVCNKLIDYKKLKIDWLGKTKSEINDSSTTNDFYLINKLRFYSGLADNLMIMDTIIYDVEESISLHSIDKYSDFFDKRYNGLNGIARWCKLEKYDNNRIFNKNLHILNTFIRYNKIKNNHPDSILVYNKKNIPLYIHENNNNETSKIRTNEIVAYNNTCTYLNNSESTNDSINKSFITSVAKNGNIKWIAYPKNQGSTNQTNTHIEKIQVLDDSTCLALWSNTDAELNNNHSGEIILSRYNWNGQLQKQTILGKNIKPKYFRANEINQTYFVISKKQTKQNDATMNIQLFTFNDSLLWEKTLQTDGEIVDVINTNNNFFVFFNCKSLSNDNKSIIDAQNSTIAGIYITQKGNIEQITTYKSEHDLEASNVFKITNNELNIVGKYNNQNNNLYLLTNEYGSIRYSNFEEITQSTIK